MVRLANDVVDTLVLLRLYCSAVAPSRGRELKLALDSSLEQQRVAPSLGRELKPLEGRVQARSGVALSRGRELKL